MKSKKKLIYIISLISLSISMVIFAFAWLSSLRTEKVEIEGSSLGAYFENGDGSVENPFEIGESKHLYNFAWLQDLGYFDDENEFYYFKLTRDIDLAATPKYQILPPIGIDGMGVGTKGDANNTNIHPFRGSFDGQGFKVKNVIIATSGFESFPDLASTKNAQGERIFNSSFDFGSSIGFFGATAGYDVPDSSGNAATSSIKNLILMNPWIKYDKNDTKDNYIGIIAGNANGTIQRVAVTKPKIDASRAHDNTVVCDNILLGKINSKLETDLPHISEDDSKVILELNIDKLIEQSNYTSSSIDYKGITYSQKEEMFFKDANGDDIELPGIKIFGEIVLRKRDSKEQDDLIDGGDGTTYGKGSYEFRFPGAPKTSFEYTDSNGNTQLAYDRTIQFTTTGSGTITVKGNANSAGRQLCLGKVSEYKKDDESTYQVYTIEKSYTTHAFSFNIPEAGTYQIFAIGGGVDVTYFKFNYDDTLNGNSGAGTNDKTENVDISYIDVVCENNLPVYDRLNKTWSNWNRWQTQLSFKLPTNHLLVFTITKNLDLRNDGWVESDDSFEVDVANRTAIQQMVFYNPFRRVFNFTEGTDKTTLNEIYFKYPVHVAVNVDDVIAKIAALPDPENLTLEDASAVQVAQSMYEALSTIDQGYVTNYSKLEACKTKITELKIENIISNINEIYRNAEGNVEYNIDNVDANDGYYIQQARGGYNSLSKEELDVFRDMTPTDSVKTYIDLLNDAEDKFTTLGNIVSLSLDTTNVKIYYKDSEIEAGPNVLNLVVTANYSTGLTKTLDSSKYSYAFSNDKNYVIISVVDANSGTTITAQYQIYHVESQTVEFQPATATSIDQYSTEFNTHGAAVIFKNYDANDTFVGSVTVNQGLTFTYYADQYTQTSSTLSQLTGDNTGGNTIYYTITLGENVSERYPLTITEVPTYTVTFHIPSNSAHTSFTTLSSQQVRKGGTINPVDLTVTKNIEFDSVNYIFAGWYNGEESSCNYLIKFKYAQSITADLHVYAKYELPQDTNYEIVFSETYDSYFTVTGNKTDITSVSYVNALKETKTLTQGFILNNSSSVSFSTDVDVIAEIKLTEAGKSIKIDGIVYTSDSNGVVMVELTSGNHTISASETVNLAYVNVIETGVLTEYYRVTFNANATTNQTVVLEAEYEDVIQGTNLGIISEPTSPGYMFLGWNTMANGNGDMIDADFVPTSNITLYAIWTQAYEITFNNMGYGNPIENVLVLPGHHLNIANYQLSQTGYIFRGWYFGTEEKCDYQTIFTSETEITRDLILYANWATTKYESLKGLAIYALDFDVMSQSERFMESTTTDYQMHNNGATLVDLINPTSANVSTSQNYVRAINGKAELIDSSNNGTQLFLDFGQKYSENIILEGYLEVTLKNQSNGWEFFQIIGSTDSITNSNIFSLAVDSGSIKYKHGNGTYNFNNNIAASNGTIYRINYIITLGNNEGSIQLNMLDTDGVSTIASTVVEYTNLSVDGVKLATTDSTTSVNSTLYVDFVVLTTSEVETVTVTLNENYVGGTTHAIQIIKGSSLRVGNLPTYNRDGYIFKGWYTDSACTNQFTNQIVSDDSLVLYAGWEVIKEYTFKFVTNSNDIVLDDVISTVVPNLEQLELDGKHFYGWYFDQVFTLKAESGQDVIDDTYDTIYLYARWEREVLINDFTNEQNILSGYQGKFAHLSDTINWEKGMNLYVKHPDSTQNVSSVTPYTNANTSEGNAILIDDNGVATLLDTTNSSTYAYFDLGETIKTGVVNGKVNVKLTTDNINSYNFFQIMGYYNEIFGELVSLGTDNNGYLQLRINANANNVIDLTNSSQKLLINKDYSYTIEYSIDYNTNTITVSTYLTNAIEKIVYTASYQDPKFGAITAVVLSSGETSSSPQNVSFDNLLITATADYIPDVTKVNFYNGSTLVTSEEPNNNGLIENWPTNPERTGYNFVGWFDASGNQVQSTQQFTQSTNLYAKFSIMTYNITFDANGGTFSTGQSTVVVPVEYAETITPAGNPTLLHYVFGGWSLTRRDKDATDGEIEYFDFSNSIVTNDLTLYAVWLNSAYINLEAKGYENALFAEWNDTDAKSNNVTVRYRQKGAAEYTTLEDTELIRQYTTDQGKSYARVDILGITEGTYEIEVTSSTGIIATVTNIIVAEYDRSGYAHFGSSVGVGAYNNDGTLKNNAQVIYVSEATKNTVTAEIGGKSYTGLVNIITATKNSSNPIAIRFLDMIYADQYAYKDFIPVSGSESSSSGGDFSNVYENKYPQLNGLYNSIKTNATKKVWYTNAQGIQEQVWDTDAVFNMCKVKDIENLTIEGVGTDAGLCQWGIHFSSSYQIEVRNLTFTDYPEDAIDIEGTAKDMDPDKGDTDRDLNSFSDTEGRFWVHHNTFNSGKNNWDLTGEQDKPLGDGSTDAHRIKNVTLSYNYYNGSQKTGLIGGDNDVITANITLAHNYYMNCGERVPLGRQANIHIYNNYYYNENTATLQGGNGQNVSAINARANSYVYAEYNAFENIRNPFETSYRNGGFTSDNGLGGSRGFVKSYNNYEDNCIYYLQTQQSNNAYNEAIEFDVSTDTNIQTVDNRTTAHSTVEDSGHKFAKNFDTSTTYFYYDSTNQVSDVTYLATEKNAIKADAKEITGALDHRIRVAGNTCVVSFETDGGTEINSVTIDRGGKVTQPDNPEKQGYTFGGWYADRACTTQFDFDQEITESTTIYAKWTANKYEITFVTEGGSSVATQQLDYDSVITQTSTPTDNSLEFKGWYTEANGNGTKIETVPYAPDGITLYAYYAEKTYSITYNLNGGINSNENPLSYTVSQGSITLENPTKTGYTFLGWTTDTVNTPTDNLTIDCTIAQNITVTAHWQAIEYSVVFDANGGSGTMNAQTFAYDQEQTLTVNTFTNNNLAFAGWSTNPNAMTVEFVDRATINNLTTINGTEITLYALWNATITFNSNSGSHVDSISQIINSEVVKPTDPTKANSTFIGWFYEESLTNQVQWPLTLTSNLTLYAKWEEKKISYSINFSDIESPIWGQNYDTIFTPIDPNNTDEAMNTDTSSITVNGTQYTKAVKMDGVSGERRRIKIDIPQSGTLDIVISSGSNRTITLVDANGNAVDTYQYSKNTDVLTTFNIAEAGTYYIYANGNVSWYYLEFKPSGAPVVEYTITWQYQTAEGTQTTTTTVAEGQTPEAPQIATQNYSVGNKTYVFNGWSPSITTVTGEQTYVAQYEETTLQYTITFNSNEGSSVADITQDAGSTVNKPTDPTKTGYTFAGWYSDSSLETLVSWPLTLNNNMTLYAKWNINQYTITWMNGENVIETDTNVDYGTYLSTIKPTDPTAPEGQVFSGWKIDNTDTIIDLAETQVTSNITLIAVFVDKPTSVTYTLTFENSAPVDPANYFTASGKYNEDANALKMESSSGEISFTTSGPATVEITDVGSGSSIKINGITVTITSKVATYEITEAGTYVIEKGSGSAIISKVVVTESSSGGTVTPNEYTITLDPNGGTVTPTSITVTEDTQIGTLPTPTRTADSSYTYAFAGWFDTAAETGGNEINSSSTFPANTTIYARWNKSAISAPNEYTVTLDANGGTVTPTSITVTEGIQIGTLPTPTRAADSSNTYEFAGWFDTAAETGGNEITSSSTFNANTTIYARWNKTDVGGGEIIITLDSNGNLVNLPSGVTISGGTITDSTNSDYDKCWELSSGSITISGISNYSNVEIIISGEGAKIRDSISSKNYIIGAGLDSQEYVLGDLDTISIQRRNGTIYFYAIILS